MQPVPQPVPGIYAGGGLATLLRANEQAFLFQQQLIVAGKSSIAVQLERIKMSYFYPFGASLQIYFTDVNGVPANPGTFEVDAQTSDIDLDGQYTKAGSLVNAGMNATFAGRIELVSFWARFLRVNITTLPNSVYSTVLVTR